MNSLGKIILPAVLALAVSCQDKPQEVFRLVENREGPTLGYSPVSGTAIIKHDGYYFKDLNRNGFLDPYEDWRLGPEERAADLASRMTVQEIAGLMLYTPYQVIPGKKYNYGGVPFEESGADPWELSDRQQKYIRKDNIRHLSLKSISSAKDAIKWNNLLQACAEGAAHGIPCSIAADPYYSQIPVSQKWPQGLALAATFDPETAGAYGSYISKTYRALGITTVFSPDIDLGTDPRWKGIRRTFGESPQLSREMAKAYVAGLQSSTGGYEISDGWGYTSVNSMVGHWPGAGTGEGGRDGSYAFGKFGVYPGDNFDMHIMPFSGVLQPDSIYGKQAIASGIVPAYNISFGQSPDSTNTGSAYSDHMINGLLRAGYGYDGVVCSGWGVTHDEGVTLDVFAGKPWGAEELTQAQRHYRLIMAGVDQFAGNDDIVPILDAYQMGVAEHGENYMRTRLEQSAVRILINIFRLGLFENPYSDPATVENVLDEEFTGQDHEAATRSVVLLKNRGNILPVNDRKKVYIPKSFYPSVKGWGGRGRTEEHWDYAIDLKILDEYYDLAENAEEADFAIVFVNSPNSSEKHGGGYDINDRTAGGNGYVPISLQYRPYTADSARMQSLAAGDPVIDSIITNRSYWEKTVINSNEKELDLILDTHGKMQGKPVIVVVNLTRAMVIGEFEDKADAIIATFGTGGRAVLDIISGRSEPSGLLPLQMPRDMITVEQQLEDVPFDMECYIDSQGNVYDFAYGLNWEGVIHDGRTEKYRTSQLPE